MAKRVPRPSGDIDKKIDSNERMTWIEEGGIDLRAARQPSGSSPAQRAPSNSSKAKTEAKPKAKGARKRK